MTWAGGGLLPRRARFVPAPGDVGRGRRRRSCRSSSTPRRGAPSWLVLDALELEEVGRAEFRTGSRSASTATSRDRGVSTTSRSHTHVSTREDPALRASHEERERVIEACCARDAGEGRLDIEELEQRAGGRVPRAHARGTLPRALPGRPAEAAAPAAAPGGRPLESARSGARLSWPAFMPLVAAILLLSLAPPRPFSRLGHGPLFLGWWAVRRPARHRCGRGSPGPAPREATMIDRGARHPSAPARGEEGPKTRAAIDVRYLPPGRE